MRTMIISNANEEGICVEGFEELKWKKGQEKLLEYFKGDEFGRLFKDGKVFVCDLGEGEFLVAVKSKIGSSPHPLIEQYEASVWYSTTDGEGCWIVGISSEKSFFSVYP